MLAYDPAQVKPGLVAFLIVAAIGLATYFLIRSMNNQLKKINFDEEPGGQSGEQPDQGAAGPVNPVAGRVDSSAERAGGEERARHGGEDGNLR